MNYDYKQILVMRKDLNMRKGKLCSQAAHASLAATLHNLDSEEVKGWLAGRFAKITCYVNSEAELIDIYNKALYAGLIAEIITDAGFTEFHGVPTKTCVAIGPGKIEDIDAVTKHLPLY